MFSHGVWRSRTFPGVPGRSRTFPGALGLAVGGRRVFRSFVPLVKSGFVCGKGTSSCGSRNRALIYRRSAEAQGIYRLFQISSLFWRSAPASLKYCQVLPRLGLQSPHSRGRVRQMRVGVPLGSRAAAPGGGRSFNSITVAVATSIH